MPLPQKPTALYVTNGWYLELPGLVSPKFETLSGLKKSTGQVEIVDAGTNIKYKFSGQILDFGQITLSRTMDGSTDDIAMQFLVQNAMSSGLKIAGVLVKRHFNNIVFSIAFDGLLFIDETYPDFDINAEEKLMVQYTATVDTWLIIP